MQVEATITEKELEFCESWYTPTCLIESLFNDFDNLAEYQIDNFGEIRPYQQALISDEALIDFDTTAQHHKLTKKEKFRLMKNVGDLYCFGARKFGKSLCVETLDLVVSMLTGKIKKVGFGSVDLIHIKEILDKVKSCFQNHPICKLWERRITSSPDYRFELKNNYVLNSVNFNIGCLDEESEILTNNGWRNINNINKNDKILSLNPNTDYASYCSLENIYKYDYNDYIYRIKGKCLDFKFTPEHKMYYNWNLYQDWQLKPLKDLNLNSMAPLLFKHSFNWKGIEKFPKISFKIYNKEVDIDFKLWLEFLGWFIAEGHLTYEKNGSYKVIMTQHKKPNPVKFQLMKETLEKLPFRFWCVKDKQFAFSNKDCFEYLKKHCYLINEFSKIRVKSKYCSYNKIIPDYVKDLPKEYLEIILKYFHLGDGSTDRGLKRFSTSSKQLADDLQEIYLKTGEACSILTKQKNRNPLYVVSQLKSQTRRIALGNSLTKEFYKGRVWCVETTPHNLILVRRNGRCIWTGNSKNPGQQFFGKHLEKLYLEEASLETDEVYNKRKDALSEMGAVMRISGMTDFTPHSPAGRAFYSLTNKKNVLNLPQYVNPMWDETEKKDRLEFYGGKSSIGYRVFVEGEVVEDSISVFDMDRIRRACYLEDTKGKSLEQIKRFELSRDKYHIFEKLIVVDRPNNAERIFINTDVGEKVTEIVIHSEFKNQYKYIYNIVLYNFHDDEQTEVLKFLAKKLQANVIGIDCGDGMGRAIYRELEKSIPADNLVWYDGSMKIDVDFEYDDNGNIVMEKGQPKYRQEVMAEWSVKRLKDLLYSARCLIPMDYKFDIQFSVVVSMLSGTRIKYKCVSSSGDHLFDAWKVFAISQWLRADFNLTPPVSIADGFGCGACSWE